MRKALFFTILAAALILPLAAHADTIDDFVLTGGGHTITYSLPATTTFHDFSLFNFYTETAPATIDGVPGYSVASLYYIFFPEFDLILNNVPSSVFGTSSLDFAGPLLFTYITVPAVNPPPYLQLDVVATFAPGTYSLTNFVPPGNPLAPPVPSVPYTLTITPETTAPPVPEPSTFVLLITGAPGLLTLAGRYLRPLRNPKIPLHLRS